MSFEWWILFPSHALNQKAVHLHHLDHITKLNHKVPRVFLSCLVYPLQSTHSYLQLIVC